MATSVPARRYASGHAGMAASMSDMRRMVSCKAVTIRP